MKLPLGPLAAALLANLPARAADLSPAQPVIPAAQFNLKAFGAAGDGATLDTGAFHRAVAAVQQAGGGTLTVPAGHYLTGPFDLCSSINFHLDRGATIQFAPTFAAYRDPISAKKYRPMLEIVGAHDVLISGPGTIDGHGEAWWPEALRYKAEANARHAGNNTSPRPIMVGFANCRRIRIEGVTLTHSAVFNLVQNRCSDVTVKGIAIFNPDTAPNTDGIDPKDCQRVLIEHCKIDTGDDDIAMGGSSGTPEHDILVTDCTFLHGHGCSIGSGTASGVHDVLVRRCTFDGTVTGVRLKSGRGRGGLAENIVYEDLKMRNVGTAISISSYYQVSASDSAGEKLEREPVTPTTPFWRNVLIRNVTATGVTHSGGLISGLPEAPAASIVLENVSISGGKSGLRVEYAQGVTLKNVQVTPAQGPAIVSGEGVEQLVRLP